MQLDRRYLEECSTASIFWIEQKVNNGKKWYCCMAGKIRTISMGEPVKKVPITRAIR
jgi:hypothetical protein